MADAPPNGKASAKLPPSQLRNEIRAESTEDERAPLKDLVDAPDSQLAIPETQLEHQDVDSGDNLETGHRADGLSPKSSAVLDKCETKKDIKTSEASSFAVRFLTKDDFKLSRSSATASSVGFSFVQPRKIAKTTPVNAIPSGPFSALGASPGMVESTDLKDASHEDANSTTRTPSISIAAVTQRVSFPKPNADVVVSEDLQLTTKDAFDHSNHAAMKLDNWNRLRVSSVPPSAQPDPEHTAIAKREKSAKRGKQKNNAQPNHLRGEPWPPRSTSASLNRPKRPSVPTATSVGLSQMATASPSVFLKGDDTTLIPKGAANLLGACREPTRECEIHASPPPPPPQEALVLDIQPRVNTLDEAKVTLNVVDEKQQSEATHSAAGDDPESACALPDEPHFSILDQPAEGQDALILHHRRRPYFMLEQCAYNKHAASPSQPHRAPVPTAQATQHDQALLNKADSRMNQTSAIDSRNSALHHAPSEVLPHDVSNRKISHRVEKPPKKSRASKNSHSAQAPAVIQPRPISANGGFEKALEWLRVTHLADQHRMKHDQAAQARHSEEVRELLQLQLHHESMTAAEWKEKFYRLSDIVSQLREKAKTNQKYVSGLQKDYEKLQKLATSSREECRKILRQQITEFDHEKEALRRQWETTLNVLAKGQKSSKNTINELYVSLIISQSKRNELSKSLEKQVEMYEEEKAKRFDLEKELLASIKSVNRQLGERSTGITERLASLQSLIADAIRVDGSNPAVEECLAQLRRIQDTPILTAKDVQKAEGMLQFMQKDFDIRMDGLAKSIQGSTCSTSTLEEPIAEQLRKLRSEMLDFDKVTAKSRQSQETCDTLRQQLLAEQQYKCQLEDRIQLLERREDTANDGKVEFERQLAEMEEMRKRNETNALGLEQETSELRQQLKAVDDERNSASAEIERLERLLQNRNHRLDKLEPSYESLKQEFKTWVEENRQLRSEIKQLKQDSESLVNGAPQSDLIRMKLRQEFFETENSVRSQNLRLTAKHDDCSRQLEPAKQDKMQVEAQLKIVQRTTHNDTSTGAEVTNLHERLGRQLEELQAKESKITELECVCAQLENDKTNLRILCEQQQAEIDHHPSAIEALCREFEDEQCKKHARANSTALTAREDIDALQRDKEALQQQLEERQDKESRLTEVHETLSAECNALRNENVELRAAQQASTDQIHRLEREQDQRIREHEKSIDHLQRLSEKANAALKEAEAKLTRQEAEFRKKLEFDCEKFDLRVETLMVELEKTKTAAATVQPQQQVQQEHSQRWTRDENFTSSLSDDCAGRKRKKVSLHNKSIENCDNSSMALADRRMQPVTEGKEQGHYLEPDQMLFGHQTQDRDDATHTQGAIDCSICEPVAQPADETQDFPGTTFTFTEPHPNLESDDESSLSTIISDDLAQLQEPVPHRLPDPRPNVQLSTHTHMLETLQRSDQASESNAHSAGSQGRPRSQANMASRMMPPPSKTPRPSGHSKTDASVTHEEAANNQVRERRDHSIIRCRESSPDFMQQHTYVEINHDNPGPNEQAFADLQIANLASSQKRNRADDTYKKSKKIRTTSGCFSNPFHKSQSDAPCASKPSAEALRSKFGKSSSQRLMLSTRSQSPLRSSSVAPDTPTPSRVSLPGVAIQSRNRQLSTSRYPVAAIGRTSGGQSSVFSNRQTRSRTAAQQDRFKQELRGR